MLPHRQCNRPLKRRTKRRVGHNAGRSGIVQVARLRVPKPGGIRQQAARGNRLQARL
jgi:hypothetical protein